MTPTTIPNRSIYRSQEVCEIAQVQPYVLKSWEAEFPDLGLAKTADGPRVYRRADVERVLRLKHLLFVEGLTLAGARRQLSIEGPAPAVEVEQGQVNDADVARLLDREVRKQLHSVKEGLHWILGVLSSAPGEPPMRMTVGRVSRAKRKHARAAKPVRSGRTARVTRRAKPVRVVRRVVGKRKR